MSVDFQVKFYYSIISEDLVKDWFDFFNKRITISNSKPFYYLEESGKKLVYEKIFINNISNAVKKCKSKNISINFSQDLGIGLDFKLIGENKLVLVLFFSGYMQRYWENRIVEIVSDIFKDLLVDSSLIEKVEYYDDLNLRDVLFDKSLKLEKLSLGLLGQDWEEDE